MFDFPLGEDPTILGCTLCTIAFLLLLKANYNDAIYSASSNVISYKKERNFLIYFIILAVAYMVDSDFYHYQESIVNSLNLDEFRWNHLEPVYAYITIFVKRNYLLFRIIVWGGASIATFLAMRRYLGSAYFGMFVLFACYFGLFSYSRASLAMAIYFWGLSFLATAMENKKMIAFGVFLVLASYEFHHSILLLIALTPLIYVPLNKFTLSLILISVPVLVLLIGDAFNMVANNELLIEDTQEGGVSGRISSYLENDASRNRSFIMLARIYYGYATFIVPFFVLTFNIFRNKSKELLPDKLFKLYKVTMGILMVSLSAIAIFGGGAMFYRTLYMMMIPLSILIVGSYQHSVISFLTYKRLVIFCMGYMIIDYVYSIYAAFMQ